MVNRLAPPEALAEETLTLARRIAAQDAQAIRIGKRAFRAQLALPLDQAFRVAGAAIVENALLPSADRGIQAFIDRR